jgi:hypothetical protein
MRRIAVCAAALILCGAGESFAQEWIQYVSKVDLFGVNFPSDPKVQTIDYLTESGITLPGRVYSVDSGQSRYLVTVVDYADAEKIHTARVEQCKKSGGEGDACQNDWRSDVQGSMVYATAQFLKRNAKVTHYGWTVVDQVEGHRLQLTNADGSRTFAEIHRHGTRLYILEATVPAKAPAPGLFQQSLMFTDEEGRSIRYRRFYTTGYSDEWKFPAPPPPRAGRPNPDPPQPAAR